MGKKNNLPKTLSHEEAVRRGRMGGIKSAEVKKRRKTLREAGEILLSLQVKDDQVIDELKNQGIEDEQLTNVMAIMYRNIIAAMNGDVKAATFIRDTVGEKPSDKLEMNADVTGEPQIQIFLPDNGRDDGDNNS